MSDRSCNGCTKCCEGWLSGESYGHKFWPGNPCHFMNIKGCSIYNKRPIDPCVHFKCQWLVDPNIPEWMKPDLINVIVIKETSKEDGREYITLVEAGSKLDSRILSWFFLQFAKGNINNLKWHLEGGYNYVFNDNNLENS